ncbi:unnamed protein product [Closterium sp. NIES-53]
MYLMTCTRPDLAYPLGLLARYVAPGRHRKVHMDVAKRVPRYLCSTSGMGLVLGGRGDVVLTGHSDASWVDDQATQRSSQGYTFSLGSGSVSWRSTRSSSVLGSSCEAEIYATAMAAQELRWLTYLVTDLGERPRSPPVRYLQQRGQLRLTYVAIRANTADIFTKALPPGDHHGFCTLLGLVPTLPHLLLRGDVVIHPELALHFLTSRVTLCSPPLCLWGVNTARNGLLAMAATPRAVFHALPLLLLLLLVASASAAARRPPPTKAQIKAEVSRMAKRLLQRYPQYSKFSKDFNKYVNLAMNSKYNFSALADATLLIPSNTAAEALSKRLPLTTKNIPRAYNVTAYHIIAKRFVLPKIKAMRAGQPLPTQLRQALYKLTGRNGNVHRTAQALYDAVVARYSSPATTALGRLLLPYLFPELSAFATVEDVVSHLRASNARYHAAAPAEDHFLSLDPTSLTVDLLEQHLLAAETSAVAVGAACGTPCPPFFEGCSPSPLAPSYASAAAADDSVAEDVGAASASAKRHSSKGKGGRGGGGGSGGGGGGSRSSGGGSSGCGGGSGTGGGSGGSGGGGGGGGSGGSGGGGTGSGGTGARRVGSGGGQRQQQQRPSETQSPQQLREWFLQRGASGGSGSCPYVIPTGDRAGQTCGRLHTQHRYLLRSRIAIFDLDFDAIHSMYALSVSAEGDCYQCVPPGPDIAAAALGASESSTLPGTAPAQALHTFTLDSGASRCFFCDSTTLTPLSAPILVRLGDPSGGPVVARSSTVLPCPAVPSGSLSGLHLPSFSTNLVSIDALQDAMVTTTTPGGQRVLICTCTQMGRHLATLTRWPGSSLYTLATEPPQTLLWHHRLGHPTLPRLRGMHSRFLCAAPHSSSFPPTTAPLQTLHMDVWGPAHVTGQGRERYFLLVVDDYTRYTTVFPLRSKGEDLPVLRLHSDRGGEFSSDLLQDFCREEGIFQSFTLPDSPQQNGIAERRIGLVMEYAMYQLNLWPRVSLPETSPTLRWTREVGDASVFLVWGSCAFARNTSADKLSARAIPCVFLGFVPDAHGWQLYHPTSRRVFPSQDVTFDESVPFYRLLPYRSAPPQPPPLFLAPGPPPVDPLLPQGPAPSGVSQVDPLPGTAIVQVVVGSSAAPRAASWGAEPGCVESEGAGSGGAGPGGEGPEGAEPAGVETGGVAPGGAESEGAESGGAEPRATGAGGAGATGAGDAGVTAGAGGTRGTSATGPGGARTRGAGAAGTGCVEGAGAGDPTEPGAAGAGAVAGGAGGAGDTVRPRPYFVPLLQQVLGVSSSTSLTPPLLCPLPNQSQLPLQPASPLPAPSPYTEQSGGLTECREPASRPVLPVRTARRIPRSRPPPVPETHAMALCPSSVPLRVPLPAPPESSLPEVPDPMSDRARAACPTVSRLLASAVTDPSFESADVSALIVELLDVAAACRLDCATALVAESASACPHSVRGERALGTDVLEDRQEDFECLAVAVPRLSSMLLAPEGDPDAPDIPTPRSYAEASTGPYSSQWQAAMDAEMASSKSTGTYVDEVPPPAANLVDGMWMFRGVDYFHTFSPTPKMTTLRVLLHVAAYRDYELQSLNFSTAFLQGSLHEEIWLRRPPGFTELFPAGTQWSLQRPVYGLHQAPREWHDTLRTTLAALGFAPATADLLFLHTDTSLPPFYVLVYVDDLVFATGDTEALTLAKSELQKRHTCTDLGELRSYLGLQITRDRARRTITLTQSHMVHQVLQRFGFQFSSPQPTPLSTSHSLSAPPSDKSVEPSGPYPELVGSLMYLMTCTRSDLAYPLSLLARYVAPARHQKVHWDAAKRVLRYLCSTSGMGLVLGGRGPVVLTGHADASWVDDSATQQSSQGYTFCLGSGSISWRSTRSSSVLSSSCEAEIYAGAMTAQELRWLT